MPLNTTTLSIYRPKALGTSENASIVWVFILREWTSEICSLFFQNPPLAFCVIKVHVFEIMKFSILYDL